MKYEPQSDKRQQQIDAALRSVGSAAPPEGLEGRVLTRLAAARVEGARGSHFVLRTRYMFPTLGFAAAGLMCAVIVVGSVEHARVRPFRGHVPAPVLVLPGQGMGAASAVHPAAPSTAPLAAGPGEHGRSTHRMSHARARIAPNARKAGGVAVPVQPAEPQP